MRDSGLVTGQGVTDATLRDVTTEIRKIDPQVQPRIQQVRLESGRSVLAVTVSVGSDPPYAYDGRSFVRIGSETARMDRAQARRMLLARQAPHERWESQPAPGFTVADLDHAEITRTVDEAIRRGRMQEPGSRDPETLLRGLDLLRDEAVTNAALILFGLDTTTFRQAYPQALLRLARFPGGTMDVFEDNQQVTGNAFALFQAAQKFMRASLPIAGRIVPGVFERADEPLYPTEALREALANALVHRDYTIGGGSLGVAIFGDRLEVVSTGLLPEGITVDALKGPHGSVRRNGRIAGVFYRRGLIEQWGRGTNKIVELTEQAGLTEPEFEERGGETLVRFLPTRYVAPSRTAYDLSPLQQDILQVLGNSEPLRYGELKARLADPVNRRTLQANLQTLRSLGLIELEGRTKGARWHLIR